ncbi:MAG: DNA-binding protein WhiA [Oscillospiraceae bacterium]|nr:DNA-binding protein WhiA [Oscillospiraceae bacterium]MBR5261190.1 DNA-binding protein WhiA [Oscillospiraceae bacterium]
MTFSAGVKAELCRQNISRECCAVAEAYGILLYCNMFTSREIKIITASRELAQRLPRLFRKAFDVEFDVLPPENPVGKSIFSITDAGKIAAVFEKFGYDAENSLVHHINLGVLEDDCCRISFIRGAFLAGGSITDPEKRCHLELVTAHMNVSREIFSILLEMGFAPKDTARAGHFVTYFKNSEAIEDFFTTIGAPASAMEMMNAKVEKDMRNAINRRVNCDSANADRIVSAAQGQLDKIRELDHEIGLDNLPRDLQEVAFLRIANPEASLSDLAMLSDPPVSKSCINHRLRKLMNYKAE